jgi:hypothetical protein
MKWIVIAILLLIVPYTFITLRYRKPGPAFQPYEDMKNRANVSRLLAAGYQRIPITAQRPADGLRTTSGAVVLPSAGGLPEELRTTLVETPLLATEILSVTAPATTTTTQPYVIQLTCALPDDKMQLGGGELYLLEESAVILPTFEPVPEGLAARSTQAAVLLSVPAGALKPGRYHVTVVGARASRGWPLEVK